MTRSLAVAAGVAVLTLPSAASAAELTISPQKRCYSSGEAVNLLGTGFSPLGRANITRDGKPLPGPRSDLPTDANGAFNGVLTLFQASGRQVKTYAATDAADPTLTASFQITVAAPRVGLKPANGAPGRLMAITARGFKTGPVLWAHVRHAGSGRNVKIGRLSGACGGLKSHRRLLPRNAAIGLYRIQFDTFRRYDKDRPVRDDRTTITVTRG
jgi:hypothetical protein